MASKPTFKYVTGDTLEELRQRKTQLVESIPTPIPSWNNVCGEEGSYEGLARTWTIVIGGRPGSKKSYLSLNMAAHAIKNGYTVGAINFEMSFEGYATRYLSVLTGVDKDEIGWGETFSDSAWDEVQEEANRIYDDTGGALITNDAAVFTLAQIREAYKAFANEDVDIVIVDYVQLVRAGQGMDLKERAGAVAETLREMSHKYEVVTVALSQLNRSGSGQSDRVPRMTDLYGGTFWEANANQVVLLDHTSERKDHNERCTRTNIIVDKNRHGEPLVSIPVKWMWDTMTIEEDIAAQQGVDEIIGSAPPGTFDDTQESEDDVDNPLEYI